MLKKLTTISILCPRNYLLFETRLNSMGTESLKTKVLKLIIFGVGSFFVDTHVPALLTLSFLIPTALPYHYVKVFPQQIF
jgi:hypothetical protein